MGTGTVLVLALAAVLVLTGVMVIATGRRRAVGGRLSRETRRADAGGAASGAATTALATTVEPGDLDAEARARADEARGALVPAGERAPAKYAPVDEEELGFTRRQFFNRGILTGMGLSIGGFGVASLAFLWPTSSSGLGTKVRIGSLDDVKAAFDKKQPFYNASARTYIVPYPKEDLDKAKKVYPPQILKGMEQGYVALYQKCVHLGCRVPWCQTSQWFECPCHGSKYNRVGEKRGGPAPRGLDRWPLEVSGGGITVDTSGTAVTGPPIGTDTTGQSPEGSPCV